ncbi:ABC transporter substrate-binding protein [Candidatus Woesearchaeota archaeon]|nr:ABC transporter substrate-binding protein [Candidatus Woesearchaeota archaeon]
MTGNYHPKTACLVVLHLLILTSCVFSSKEELTIGLIAPMTGPAAMIGESLREGALLAIQQQNASITLVSEDSLGDTKTAVTAFQKMVVEDVPDAVVVATGVEAIAPLAEQYQIPIIATITSADGIPELGSYTFRYFTHAEIDAATMAEYATEELNLSTFATLFSDSAFGYSYDDVFTDIVNENGGSVLLHEGFPFANQDFKTSLLKIAAMHPDAIYVVGLDFEILTALHQMEETGFPEDIAILAVGTITTEEVIGKSGTLVNGIYSSAFCNPLPRTYVDAFHNKYGKLPDFFSLFGYDSIRLLKQASGADGDIKESLLGMGTFAGLIGNITIDQNGETHFDMCPMQIRGSKLLNLKTGQYFTFASELRS